MNEKEISEIRRRFRPDRSGISHIRGCYVNENREIVSQFDQSLGLMSQEESEKLLAIDVNIDITQMLDTAWTLFAEYFSKEEVGIKAELIKKYWKE